MPKAAVPILSIRMLHALNLELELWGGPAVALGDPLEVAWLLGADLRLGFLWNFDA